MAAPLLRSQLSLRLPRPTLGPRITTPLEAEERYVVSSVTPMPWASKIIPYLSNRERHSLMETLTELVFRLDDLEMLKTDEEPNTTRLQNIVFTSVENMHWSEYPVLDPDQEFDSYQDEASGIVGEMCAFIEDNLYEIARPVTAIVDPRCNISRAEAWILRCSMHPDVLGGDEQVRTAWQAWLDEYLGGSEDYWELESDDDDEEDDIFEIGQLRLSSSLPSQPEERVEFEPLRDVELEPYGPQREVEDLAQLVSYPAQDERCTICLEAYGGEAEGSACQQLKVCEHTFHEVCIDTWINASHAGMVSCPNCRAEICDRRPRRRKQREA